MWLKRFEGIAARVMRVTIPFVALLLIGLVYYLGVRSERSGFVSDVIDPGLKRIARPVLNAFRGRPPVIPLIHLTMDEAALDSLINHLVAGPVVGTVPPVNGPSIPATATIDEQRVPVLLSLALDRNGPDTDPPALQLTVQGSDTLLGRQAMILVPVRNEGPLRNWLFHEILQDQGQPSFPVRFIEARILERPSALHALQAQIDSTLMHAWGRGDGPVLRFDDELLRHATAQMTEDPYPVEQPFQADWLSAPIKTIHPVPDPPITAASRRLRSAARSLDELRSGRLSASAVFDAPAAGRLLALCDLFGAQAAIDWPNLCFLADSTTGRLLMVPSTGGTGTRIVSPLVLRSQTSDQTRPNGSTLLGRLLGDTVVFSHYVQELERMTGPGWMEEVLARLGPAITQQLRVLRTEMPVTYPDTSVFYRNRRVIRSTLHPVDIALAYVQDQKGPVERIAIANVHALPITIDAVISGSDTLMLKRPVQLRPRQRDQPLAYERVDMPLDLSTAERPRLLGHVTGTSERRSIPLRTWISLSADP